MRHQPPTDLMGDSDTLHISSCKCGWQEGPTDVAAASKAALAHSDPEWLEKIKDDLPFLDGTLPMSLKPGSTD